MQPAESPMSAAAASYDPSDIVNLNVGGRHFSTSRATLCRDPDSMLAAMFGGNFQPGARDPDGRVFIDRDGDVFCHVINYLRSMRLEVPENFTDKARLVVEAEYFGLRHLQELLTSHRSAEQHSITVAKRFAELWLMESAPSCLEQFYHPHFTKTKTMARIQGPEAVIRRLELDCVCQQHSPAISERALMDKCRVMRLELVDNHDKLNYLAELCRLGGRIISHSSSVMDKSSLDGYRCIERYVFEFSFVDQVGEQKENSSAGQCDCVGPRVPLGSALVEKAVPILMD